MRNPASVGTHLPTVEDRSTGSGSSADNSSRVGSMSHSVHGSEGNIAHNGGGAPRMKRSPYLSVMAGSTKSSEDLVAMLSRPAAGGEGEGMGLKRSNHAGHDDDQGGLGGDPEDEAGLPSPGGGRSSFFDLKRPSSANPIMSGFQGMAISPSHTVTPVSSAGGEIADDDGNGEGSGANNSGNNSNASPHMAGLSQMHQAEPVARPMPSLRSALRMGSRSNMKALTASANAQQAELRKNTSVTFSNTTKHASQLGINEMENSGNARFIFPPTDEGGTQAGQQQQMMQPHQPTRVGFQQVAQMRQFSPQQPTNYSTQMMMKKSQSIAAPQFMLAHQNSVTSSQTTTSVDNSANANQSFGEQGGDDNGGGNVSFPIYLGKLPGDSQQQQVPAPPTPNKTSMMQGSKSMNTMKYYAQNSIQNSVARDPAQKLLHAAGMTGIQPVTARPSMNGLNLTFREMLDEGDGVEGDLNLRSRNQQWKHFRSFSEKFGDENPMMQAAMATDQSPGAPIQEAGSFGSTSTTPTDTSAVMGNAALSGSKRTLTPNSFNSQNSGGAGATGSTHGNKPFAGAGGMPPQMRARSGSNRGAVSVNDLAVLRRAAARQPMGQMGRRTSQKLPGETLGGGMLSRISSQSTEGGFGGNGQQQGLSPMAQMMARNKGSSANLGGLSRGASGSSAGLGGLSRGSSAGLSGVGGGMGSRQGSFANDQQKEMFMQKFQMAMSQNSGGVGANSGGGGYNNPAAQNPLAAFQSNSNLGPGGMGRRSRTVGAGLAYGRATTTVDIRSGFRLSKFNLGDLRKEDSRLSQISSTGSSGGGKNEEWDLS